MYVCTYMYIVHQWPVFKDEGLRIGSNSEKKSSKHSPGIQVKKRANLDLSTAPTRSSYAWRHVCARSSWGAAVLANHLQLVRGRSIIKEVRSLLVPKQHLPLKTSFSATSSSTTRAALRWCFPPPPVSLFRPYPPPLRLNPVGC